MSDAGGPFLMLQQLKDLQCRALATFAGHQNWSYENILFRGGPGVWLAGDAKQLWMGQILLFPVYSKPLEDSFK